MTNDSDQGHRFAITSWIGIGAIVGVSLIVGCNSDQNVGNYAFHPTCTAPGEVDLVYPVPSSTNVPDNVPEVVLASSSGELSADFRAYVVDGANVAYFSQLSQPIDVTTIPTPSASPSFENPVFQVSASSGTTWPPGTSVSVYLGSSQACTPALLLGTFVVAGSPAPTAKST